MTEYTTLIEGRREKRKEKAISIREMAPERKLDLINKAIRSREGFGLDIIKDDKVYMLMDLEWDDHNPFYMHWIHRVWSDKVSRCLNNVLSVEATSSPEGKLVLSLKVEHGIIVLEYDLGRIILRPVRESFATDITPDYEAEAVHAIMTGYPQEVTACP